MRKVDALVIEYPKVYLCIDGTDIDKPYEMPKCAVTYLKPRRLSRGTEGGGKRENERNKLHGELC